MITIRVLAEAKSNEGDPYLKEMAVWRATVVPRVGDQVSVRHDGRTEKRTVASVCWVPIADDAVVASLTLKEPWEEP